MATTSPDNIWTPDAGDDYDLVTDLAAMADSIQDALNNFEAVDFADDTETIAGVATDLAVTPAGLASLTATDTRRGLVELADDAETIARTDASRAITSAGFDAAMKDRPIQGRIPSSVTVGSGSASVAADGTVTFTGVSSMSLNDIFDGLGMDSYRCSMAWLGTNNGTSVNARMRVSGTDYSGASDYYGSYLHSTNGAAATFGAGNLSQMRVGYSGAAPLPSVTELTIWRPGVAGVRTMLSGIPFATQGVTGFQITTRSEATAEDGMTIFASAGTITGTLKVVKV